MFAPLNWTGPLATLVIGFLFGFVLERAGFGNSRNLAAQFYLTDMRVLKVMFTAIVTAMILVFACSAIGILDFDMLWVPPTHLGPAVVGGLALGFGFILGGYCPGTSLVSAATLKIDGLFFALGVAFGIFVFGVTAPAYAGFWEFTGAMGRLTWADVLHVDAGILVLAVFVMAIGAFAAAELAERTIGRNRKPSAVLPVSKRTLTGIVGLGTAIVLTTVVIGQPDLERRMTMMEHELAAKLDSREVFVDPAEVYELMNNRQLRVLLLDVRPEPDYNLFHLRDAQRIDVDELTPERIRSIPVEAVVIVMSNDEAAAVEAWRRLAVFRNTNAYVLAGGVNRWLDLFYAKKEIPDSDTPPQGNDTFRYADAFHRDPTITPVALGDRPAFAQVDAKTPTLNREYTKKVHLKTTLKAPKGGCG
ncbi:hypothetical protein JCM19992_24210 [Thermostilla marina]